MGSVKKQDAFTLVELVIVLAISGSLFAMAFFGQSQQRQTTQFSTDIDSIVNRIKDVQSQAYNGVSFGAQSTGASNFTFYGKQIEVADTFFQIETNIKDSGGGVLCSSLGGAVRRVYGSVGICQIDSSGYSYPSDVVLENYNGVCAGGAAPLIEFTYAANSTSAQMGLPQCGQLNSGSTMLPADYKTPYTYIFDQVGGSHKAYVTLDPVSNTISRTIQ